MIIFASLMIHRFKNSITGIPLPGKFTYPFNYTPHPLCIMAADEVKKYLYSHKECLDEIEQGKMFGVLIVKDSEQNIGYLAAYSGIISTESIIPFFVPPVYDLLSPSSFFKAEEDKISMLNREIEETENNAIYNKLKSDLANLIEKNHIIIEEERIKLKSKKAERDKKRNESGAIINENELIKESQYLKAEFKMLTNRLKAEEEKICTDILIIERHINELKEKRKNDSAKLQKRLFSEFKFLNALGQEEDLWTIFSNTISHIPPAGAGECAAPKMLQYAFKNGLHPIAMAEFWIGKSPQKEIRKEGYFYPSCKGKCLPILTHMLKGLEVDEDPLLQSNKKSALDIVYEDDYLMIINKPSGMLSVPGKGDRESVESIVRKMYPQIKGPMIVHRLDMSTSGLLIITKSKEVHKQLQSEFAKREVKKRYIALLDGYVKEDKGFIRLPLIHDYMERPRQKVDMQNGKPAITRYEVIERTGNDSSIKTRIALYPLTGRTHQLRVHCAYKYGLDAPIIGDELYGKKSDRLYLHAERIEFRHPVTNKIIYFEKKADF